MYVTGSEDESQALKAWSSKCEVHSLAGKEAQSRDHPGLSSLCVSQSSDDLFTDMLSSTLLFGAKGQPEANEQPGGEAAPAPALYRAQTQEDQGLRGNCHCGPPQ